MESAPTVRELMCPVDDFPKVTEQSFFFDIVMALEKARWDFRAELSSQTVLLVEDKDKNIVGKISQRDVVRALDPKHDKINGFKEKDSALWEYFLSTLCEKAWIIKAGDIYSKPDTTQTVGIDERIETVYHLFATTKHEYLYVIVNEKIVGLIRFYDIYKFICKKIYQCEKKSYL